MKCPNCSAIWLRGATAGDENQTIPAFVRILQELKTVNADVVIRRGGVVRTKAVDRRTTLLLVRLRYHIETEIKGPRGKEAAERRQLLA
jgi:hypothetical protein